MFAERILNIHVAIRSTLLFLEAHEINKADWLPESKALSDEVQLQRLIKLNGRQKDVARLVSLLQPLKVGRQLQAAAQPTSKLSRSALIPAITPSYQDL
jgi:hypothetical protein